MDLLEKLFEIIRGLVRKDRATSMGDVYGQVWERLYEADPDAWLTDLYVDEATGQMFAVAAKGGKLYRADVTSDTTGFAIGVMEEVVHEFRPVEGRSRLRVKRDAAGVLRWFAFPACTAVLDRVGEIDSTALFDSFVAALERGGQYPYLTFYHQGEALQMGRADFVDRDGYALLMSGTFDDTPLARAAAEAIERDGEYWGTSIGYTATQAPEMLEVGDGITVPVYTAGVLREVSILPEKDAAALFTSLAAVERSKPMRKEVKEALLKLTGGDEALVTELEERTDSVNRAAESGNLIRREGEAEAAPDATAPAPEETEETDSVDAQIEIDEAVIAAVSEQVRPTLSEQIEAALAPIKAAMESLSALASAFPTQTDALTRALDDLRERVEAVERAEAEKQAEWKQDLPARSRVTVTYRPRQAQAGETGKSGEESPSFDSLAAETLSKIRK